MHDYDHRESIPIHCIYKYEDHYLPIVIFISMITCPKIMQLASDAVIVM